MDRYEFAKDVVIADLQRGQLVAVTPMLRALAQDCPVPHEIIATHDQRAAQARVCLDDAAGTDSYRTLDHNIRSNLDIGCDDRLRVDQSCGMDQVGVGYRHRSSPPAGGSKKSS